MKTNYCAKFKDTDENNIRIDFLESKIVNDKHDECVGDDLKKLFDEKENNEYRKNKILWMFNNAMYNFSNALFEVEIGYKMDFTMQTLVDSLIKYMVSFDLKDVNVRFTSGEAINAEVLIHYIDEFNRCRDFRGYTNKLSVSYNVELASGHITKILELFSKCVSHSNVTVDIQNFIGVENCINYIMDNTLNIYYDISQMPMYTEGVKNQLLKLLTVEFNNINVFSVNKLNIPDDIYNEAQKMFFKENGINGEMDKRLSTVLFESVCNAIIPNNFVVDSIGNIRKCRHHNNSQTVIGTIINGEFEIDFSKFLKWTTPNNELICNKGCINCFYFPCCQGAACKYYELIQNELCCPQKFEYLSSRLIKES